MGAYGDKDENDSETQVIGSVAKDSDRHVLTPLDKSAGEEAETQMLDSMDKNGEVETQKILAESNLEETNNNDLPLKTTTNKRPLPDSLLKSLVAPSLDKLETQDFDDALGCSFDEDKENLVNKRM